VKYKCIVTCSWDDGHKLDLKLANLLLRYRLRGTFFIPIRCLGNSLSKEDIIFLSKYFEIGAHSLTHPYLTRLPLNDADREIMESKRVLEDIMERRVYGFSYPYGDFNNKIVKCVIRSGYTYARTNKPSKRITDPYRMGVTAILRRYVGIREFLVSMIRVRRFKSLVGATFDDVYSNGGVWHMLGHSWQIEKLGMWDDLEEILSYISNRKDVLYATNHEVIQVLTSNSFPSKSVS